MSSCTNKLTKNKLVISSLLVVSAPWEVAGYQNRLRGRKVFGFVQSHSPGSVGYYHQKKHLEEQRADKQRAAAQAAAERILHRLEAEKLAAEQRAEAAEAARHAATAEAASDAAGEAICAAVAGAVAADDEGAIDEVEVAAGVADGSAYRQKAAEAEVAAANAEVQRLEAALAAAKADEDGVDTGTTADFLAGATAKAATTAAAAKAAKAIATISTFKGTAKREILDMESVRNMAQEAINTARELTADKVQLHTRYSHEFDIGYKPKYFTDFDFDQWEGLDWDSLNGGNKKLEEKAERYWDFISQGRIRCEKSRLPKVTLRDPNTSQPDEDEHIPKEYSFTQPEIGEEDRKPVLIIMYGVPGSGKGRCLEALFKSSENLHLNINDFVHLDADLLRYYSKDYRMALSGAHAYKVVEQKIGKAEADKIFTPNKWQWTDGTGEIFTEDGYMAWNPSTKRDEYVPIPDVALRSNWLKNKKQMYGHKKPVARFSCMEDVNNLNFIDRAFALGMNVIYDTLGDQPNKFLQEVMRRARSLHHYKIVVCGCFAPLVQNLERARNRASEEGRVAADDYVKSTFKTIWPRMGMADVSANDDMMVHHDRFTLVVNDETVRKEKSKEGIRDEAKAELKEATKESPDNESPRPRVSAAKASLNEANAKYPDYTVKKSIYQTKSEEGQDYFEEGIGNLKVGDRRFLFDNSDAEKTPRLIAYDEVIYATAPGSKSKEVTIFNKLRKMEKTYKEIADRNNELLSGGLVGRTGITTT